MHKYEMAANEFWFCRMPISWDIDMANLAGKDINVCEKPKRKLEGQLAITTHNIVRHNVGDIFGSRSCHFLKYCILIAKILCFKAV